MGGVRLARWGWCLTCLFAFLSASVCLFPRLGSAAKYPAPPLDGVVYPSLIVPPERVESSPIAEKCYKCHGQEKEAYEWAQSGHAHNLEALRASP
ncbi:MAG: hypothetical protein KatS3mg115_2117 [Candidatus Poribacteria bacterium]|nr:MAG: hypothetical protein KatS3mg115_2117 [Candidatus Poribacteria bacterium]